MADRIPRDKNNDYTEVMAQKRRDFAESKTSTELNHIGHYSVDPGLTAGNIENFIGVAQVPMGLMGPLLVDGEHAQGEFYVPMATSEGTLVASYNRGASLLREAGGAKVTVVDDAMQRAPVFIFEDARQARMFGEWVSDNFDRIAEQAESTTSSGKLRNIQQFSAARMRYLRFNYTTGDAAGQKRAEFGGDVFFGEGVDHGKRVDALKEIVAGRLSEFFVGGDDVENVVDDLEGHAVGESELGERFDNRAR